ncbi:hypothetical protein J3F83DRAFT_490263 [Trichoderma novae-zelandiae]
MDGCSTAVIHDHDNMNCLPTMSFCLMTGQARFPSSRCIQFICSTLYYNYGVTTPWYRLTLACGRVASSRIPRAAAIGPHHPPTNPRPPSLVPLSPSPVKDHIIPIPHLRGAFCASVRASMPPLIGSPVRGVYVTSTTSRASICTDKPRLTLPSLRLCVGWQLHFTILLYKHGLVLHLVPCLFPLAPKEEQKEGDDGKSCLKPCPPAY